MSEEVTVQVTITERVRYSAFVKMPREQFEELETALEEGAGTGCAGLKSGLANTATGATTGRTQTTLRLRTSAWCRETA